MSPKSLVDKYTRQGMNARQIFDELEGRLAFSSIRRYMQDVIKGMTDDERKIMNSHRLPVDYKRKIVLPFSNDHVKIGLKLSLFRIKSGLTHQQFVSKHGLTSRQTLSSMESGRHDFTLTEMQKIVEILNSPLEVTL